MTHKPTITNPTTAQPAYIAACECGWTERSIKWQHARALHRRHVETVRAAAIAEALALLEAAAKRCLTCYDPASMEFSPSPCPTCRAAELLGAVA